MGNETSFRSFPAHVHNLLTVLLAETHVVHTKIYPRYRSKRNISFARDDLSKWLDPHTKEKTDVVLLGHSMGGLVSAELVLMPAPALAYRPFNHRILGVINFDVPFLGMHPGVIKSGLSSIFKPADEPGDKFSPEIQPQESNNGSAVTSPSVSSQGRADTFWGKPDPNYNPTFENDVMLPMRKGWRNAWHFVNKHSGELTKATKQLVTSHLEFGGAMANYGELKTRYARIRALEEENPEVRKSVTQSGGVPARVRFVNYYTASTGRPKRRTSPQSSKSPNRVQSIASLELPAAAGGTESAAQENGSVKSELSRTPSPRISLEEHHGDRIEMKDPDIPEDIDEHPDTVLKSKMQSLDPQALSEGEHDDDWAEAAESLAIDDSKGESSHVETKDEVEDGDSVASPTTMSRTSTLSTIASLPPIPDAPAAPAPLDVSFIQDKDIRKLVEKEHARAVKAYDKAVKDREKVIKDRAKLEEKHERKARKEAEKASKNGAQGDEMAKKRAFKAEDKARRDSLKSIQLARSVETREVKEETSQATGEELRLRQEKLRMENEGRRMRGEPPLSELPSEDKPLSRATTDRSDRSDFEPKLLSRATTSKSEIAARQKSLERRFGLDATEDAPYRTRSPSPVPSSGKNSGKEKAPPKDRKFCTLPPKDSHGERDPTWVRVFMKDVDEVGAHCGLFFVDERYERLVGDVSERIEGWVREDNDERLSRDMGLPLDEKR